MPPTVIGALVTASVTNPWRRADRTPAVDSVSFAQTVCPEPTATVDAAWSWSTLQAVTEHRCRVDASAQEPARDDDASNTHGSARSPTRTAAPPLSPPAPSP